MQKAIPKRNGLFISKIYLGAGAFNGIVFCY